jgi:hypothetical protein
MLELTRGRSGGDAAPPRAWSANAHGSHGEHHARPLRDSCLRPLRRPGHQA